MYRGSLFSTLRTACTLWRNCSAESSAFAAWLNGGTIDLRNPSAEDSGGWLAMQIKLAVILRVDGAYFRHRRLTGVMGIDTHPEFWAADAARAQREGLAPPDPEKVLKVLEHFKRYAHFKRIDEYHLTGGKLHLAGGLDLLFADYIEMLREHLTAPRQFKIIDGEGDLAVKPRHSACVLTPDYSRHSGGWEAGYTLRYQA